ncbi:hypothetical protein SAV14893_045110 [Streptomyces avermitilis]|uniref:Secreted protein n=1 Tax=Streptomyces avermitilis TaxID=33903 RepID=A0A4D4M0L7_STRAX|nr:hypothetical protein [Streptomyces avermitilis]GDY65118.1 hypothetical protein SAV14893_045110 [Streptomyces avermitilis]
MHRPARSRAAVAVITSILSLSLATGCSGTKSDSADDGSGKGSRSTGAAKALSKPELAKSIIAQGDVKGYKVGSADRADAATTSKDDIKVVDEKCEPLAYVLSGFAPGDSTAYVNRQVTEKKAAPSAASDLSEDATEEEFEDALTEGMSVSVTIVSLSSYEGTAPRRPRPPSPTHSTRARTGSRSPPTATARSSPRLPRRRAPAKVTIRWRSR